MSETDEKHGSLLGDIHLRLFASLVLHTAIIYVVIVLGRVTTSYAAVELDLSFIWVGIISCCFSILPIFLAVPLGRFIDRGYDALAVRLGCVALFAAGCVYAFAPTGPVSLMIGTALLGIGQIGCMAGHQMIAIRAGKTRRGRDAVFGYQMVALALGQACAPLVIAWIAGDARVPPVDLIFHITLGVSCVALACSFLLPAAERTEAKDGDAPKMSLGELLRMRGLPAYILASITTITALDLVTIYLPLLGAERHMDVATVGWLMSVRAISSMFARLLYVPLMDLMGRMGLTYVSMLSPALAFVLVGLPMPLWLLFPAMAVAGLGLGVAATLTLSGIVDIAPTHARATAMSLRLTGNRVGMVVIPMVAGVVATAAGAAGVFLILALTLSSSAGSIWKSRRGS